MKYLLDTTTLRFDSDKCTGCGRCTEVCPHGVFAVDNKKVRVADKDSCMECGACMKNCAFGAIEVDAGVGCAFAIINSMIYGGKPSCDCGPSDTGASSCC
ncbi:mercury methylation ferredoxin HgcB [Nitrospirota bacterium]